MIFLIIILIFFSILFFCMGSAAIQPTNIDTIQQIDQIQNVSNDVIKDQKKYEIDVIQVSNIALAIKHRQHTINVQLTLRCENLPIMKTFGSTDSMVVIYKYNDDNQVTNQKTFVEIGRTEIVRNNLNPKYINSHILSYNEDKKQQIEFRIYDIKTKSDDLQQQTLIATTSIKLETLVDNQTTQIQISTGFRKKQKSLLKVDCIQYDGGNSKYEIGLELNNFSGTKSQMFYVIQVLKLNEWIPIARSEKIEIKKNNRFSVKEVAYNKFQGEDNSRIKIKIFEVNKKQEEEEIGIADQITIINIYTNDDKIQTQRVYQSGFVIGMVTIYKWRKIIRDSFISYIVNDAHLNLIVAIDFTNSNVQGSQSLHQLQSKANGQLTNPYIEAIQEIIGVLQYFNYCNQMPLYGFGAKLPPYYKCVGNCFALNGNYFNPTVMGGVQQVIKYYKQNLMKVKLHGPTKLSQVLDLAIQYAESEPQSLNYYVLVIFTDGQINDFDDTVDRIVRASHLPLSIVLVGIGEKDFSNMYKLDKDSDKQLLKSQKYGKIQRDIVDFIRVNDFSMEPGSITLARQTFAEIPVQFIDYMTRKKIKPSRQKKSLKAAKAEFISEKIKQSKKSSNDTQAHIVIVPQFLQYKKRNMKKELVSLGFEAKDPLLQNLNIAMNDISYFIEVHSSNKQTIEEKNKCFTQEIAIRQTKKLQQYLQKIDQQNKKKTLQRLQKAQSNQYGRSTKTAKKKQIIEKQQVQPAQHPCTNCQIRQVNILHGQCGHASVCRQCCEYRCPICYLVNEQLICFNFVDNLK